MMPSSKHNMNNNIYLALKNTHLAQTHTHTRSGFKYLASRSIQIEFEN